MLALFKIQKPLVRNIFQMKNTKRKKKMRIKELSP